LIGKALDSIRGDFHAFLDHGRKGKKSRANDATLLGTCVGMVRREKPSLLLILR
jgi:hypothetical protein